MWESSSSSASSPAWDIIRFCFVLFLGLPRRYAVIVYISVLIAISLMTNDVENLFMSLSTICMFTFTEVS